MAAIGFGLLAAFLWGIGTVVGARLVRAAGAWGALGATMPIGLALIAPFLLFVDRPSASGAAWAFAVGAGIGYVGGMACWMLAVRRGKVSVVSPIVSTDGAMAAIFAVALFGESLAPGVAAALAVVVAGIVVVAIRPETGGRHGQFTGRELTLALASAAFFGFSFVAGGEAQDGLGVVWTLFVSRLISTSLVVPFLVARGGFRIPRGAIPFAVMMATLDLTGFAAFLAGAASSVAIASVLASQYAVVSVIAAYLAFGERLTRLQTVGVGITLVGIAALAFLRG